jgi:hypothetical protein
MLISHFRALARFSISRFALFTSVAWLCCLSALAQGQFTPGPQVAPHSRKPPVSANQEQFVGYWTTETGWHSELHLRNNLAALDLTVIPALRSADGVETQLSAITIKSQEVKSIDIEAAIPATAPQLIGTYGSIILRYRSPGLENLYAALMVRNIGHSIAFHIDATAQLQNYEAASREGIWWLPNGTADGYLIFANQGNDALQLALSLYDASGKESRQNLIVGPSETSRYSVRKLVQAAGPTGSYGGIKIDASAHAGSLETLHFIFDQTAGFSAFLKMFGHDPNARMEERDFAHTSALTLRAPMLALTHPDSALAFPVDVTLQPELLIRNTTSKPVSATLRFSWRGDNSTGRAAGPALQLFPYETRRVDVAMLQDGKTLPKDARWTSVTLTTNSKPDEVMAVAVSYDSSLHYGAQTPFSDQLSFAWEGGQWEYDPQHNSLITAGNGGTKPTQVAFTIFYNQGTKRYDLEQTLQQDEQMWIDVGKLIREHVPDKNGNVLPTDLSSGSYEFRDLTDPFVGTLFEGKVIYEKTFGHVTYGCAQCCSIDSPYLAFNPLDIGFGLTAPTTVMGTNNCTGTLVDLGTRFYYDWSTANPAIATVDSYGTHTGAGVGSTTSTTFAYLPQPVGLKCLVQKQTVSGTDNVTPSISSISPPQGLIGTTVSVTISGSGFGSNPIVNTVQGITASVQSSSDTSITANFAISATSPVTGSTNVTVTNVQQSLHSNGVNFYIQIPLHLQRINNTCAPNGVGSAVTGTDISIVDCAGNVKATHACGGYENFTYQLMDQQSPPQRIVNGSVTFTENFGNITPANANPPFVPAAPVTPNLSGQVLTDIVAIYTVPNTTCPPANLSQSADQGWQATIGSGTHIYGLSTVIHITRNTNSSGLPSFTSSITTP